MKKVLCLLLLCLCFACKKAVSTKQTESCNLKEVKTTNNGKVSITSGIWGTASHRQGNCMPVSESTTCLDCPIQTQVRIYAYTTFQDAKRAMTGGPYFDSFSTGLIKTINTDAQGFFQTDLPDGKYTIALVQEGKLFANMFDGQGGIWPVSVSQGKVNIDLVFDTAVY
jgi:hypothetical protein